MTLKQYKTSKAYLLYFCEKFASKYIFFDLGKKQNPKTWIIEVFTEDNHILLGKIRWYAQWRQYGFFPEDGTVYEKTCMKDITKFLIELNTLQRLGIKPDNPQKKLMEIDS